jgi:hypothetical protein
MIKKLRNNYMIKSMNMSSVKVVQDRINRILIYDNDFLLHTIIVLVISVFVNTEPLQGLRGEDTKMNLGIILDELDRYKNMIKSLIDNPMKPKEKTTFDGIVNKVTEHDNEVL